MDLLTNNYGPVQSLMMKMQMPFIFVLNKVLSVTLKLTPKQREILTFILSACCSIFFIIVISRFNPIDMQKKAIVFSMGMIALTLVNLDKKVEARPWNLPLMIPYYIVAVLMIITSFTHNTGRGDLELIGLIMIVIFTPFYIVMGNKKGEEIEKFFMLLAKGFCYTGLVYVVVLILFFPQATQYQPEEGVHFLEYLGINRNPNALGFVLCSIVACSIYLYIKAKDKVVPLIVIAISLQLMILSVARASQLATVAMLLGMTILIIYSYKQEGSVKRGLILAVIGISFILCTQPLVKMLFDYVQVSYASTGEVSLYERLNSLSSGRLDVYKYYIENITLFGKDASEGYISIYGDSLYAHNNYLEIAFKSGIIAGLGYLIMILMTMIYSIKMVSGTKGKVGMFSVIMLLGFLPYSMLETAIIPFHDGFMALVYIIIASVVVQTQKET